MNSASFGIFLKRQVRAAGCRLTLLFGVQWCTLVLVIRLDTQKTHLDLKSTNYPI